MRPTMIEVIESGWSSTTQDLGRHGYAHLGITGAGAVDRGLAAMVNRVVGNDVNAAVIETSGGLVLRSTRAVLLTSTDRLGPMTIEPGEAYRVDPDPLRLWQYVAVRGGFDVEQVLGSRSSDTLSGLGPPVLQAGDMLKIGPDPSGVVRTDVAPMPAYRAVVRITPGPRLDWFEPSAIEYLTRSDLVVAASSRIGVRLTRTDGVARIERFAGAELPSEGLVRGAIQMPPSGIPVMMSCDHPTTGGYPVIAVVHPADVVVVAQVRPGQQVRLRWGGG